jgi:hypothetical protein
MDIRLLRLVHGQILPQIGDAEATRLEQIFQLVRSTGYVQTEPDSMASELLERLRASDRLEQFVVEIRRKIQGGNELAVADWLLLSYLATFKRVLEDQWDAIYTAIFEHYPALGGEINRVKALVEGIPFAAAVTLLEKYWDDNGKSPRFQMVALTYVTACGLITIFGGSRLYDKASECLALDKEFLVVILAGACFKVPAIAARVDIGTWTDSQYACMSVLDNFADLGETAWG